MRDQEFFRGVADRGGVVDHKGAWVDVLEDVGGADVGHVEGRVLAHQHHVHACQVDGLRLAGVEVGAGLAAHGDGAGEAGDAVRGAAGRLAAAFAQGEVAHFVVPERMAAGLGLEHQGEGAVAFDVDGFQRVHLDRDVQCTRHACSRIVACVVR